MYYVFFQLVIEKPPVSLVSVSVSPSSKFEQPASSTSISNGTQVVVMVPRLEDCRPVCNSNT